jgi:Holliday junction DNA helicase RuvA
MIARLRGLVEEKGRDFIVVDVGGVGYQVFVSGATLATAGPSGSELTLRTFIYVREDALQLFGFLTAEEQETFERLLAVSGIGPRMALSFLTQFTPGELAEAVRGRDATALALVRGVGKRTAERMIIDLQGKLSATGAGAGDTPRSGPAGPAGDPAADALLAFGYTPAEAAAALAAVPGDDAVSVEERVMLALRQLDRTRG